MGEFAKNSIRHCIAMLASYDCDDGVNSGKRQFYDFMKSIYEDMLLEPEKYYVYSDKYEAYIAQTDKMPQKEKEHQSDSRESTLRNSFQQAISFYALFFYHLGTNEKMIYRQDHMVIPVTNYRDVIHKMETYHNPELNAYRYEVLKEKGVKIKETDDNVIVSFLHCPYAVQGLEFLCKALESKYKLMNYLRLDYKNAENSSPPSLEDVYETLPVESVRAINKIVEALDGLNLKVKVKPLRGIVSDFHWKVEFVYKGKNVFGFYADRDYFMLCIYFNNYKNINEFVKQLLIEDQALFEWLKKFFIKRECKCSYNRRILLGDEYRRICGFSNRAEIVSTNSDDIENAIKTITLFHVSRSN